MRKMTTKTFLIAGILLCVSAAGALAGSARSDTLDFGKSEDCAAAYKKFQSRYVPAYFGVAEGGKLCIYSFCGAACQSSSARSLTSYRCEKESGTSCRIYGASEEIPGITEN